jgi:Fe/S biogenesis protein NfuA
MNVHIHLFDGERLTAVDTGVGRPLRWAAWQPDGSWCLLVGNGGVALRYAGQRFEPIATGTKHNLRGVAFSPDGRRALLVGNRGEALLYDEGSVRALSSPTTENLRRVAWRPQGDYALIVGNGGTAQPEFALNFVVEGQATENDTVVDVGEFRVYVDVAEARFLEDATVDFIDTLTESGFKVDAPNAGVAKPEGPVAEAIVRVLEEKINPAVAAHGGHISLVGVQDETAYLRFGGGCQGCGMVNVTLKQGVERVIFEEIPKITKVMDVTDHAAGQNPYYQPGK